MREVAHIARWLGLALIVTSCLQESPSAEPDAGAPQPRDGSRADVDSSLDTSGAGHDASAHAGNAGDAAGDRPSVDGVCGNGIVEPPEACDDANTASGDGCSEDCSSNELCPDGVLDGDYSITGVGEMNALSGCASITGNLHVRGPELTDLDPLTSLTSVERAVTIGSCEDRWSPISCTRNQALRNINGLRNLRSAGALIVEDNPSLTELDGLNNLSSIATTLRIEHNSSLRRISGLNGLTSAVSGVTIRDNPSLARIDGLNNLSLAAFVSIRDNNGLASLDGLLKSVHIFRGDIWIDGNRSLTSLLGLSRLVSVEGELRLGEYALGKGNAALANLEALSGLVYVRALEIGGNYSLVSLEGLTSLAAVGSLTIRGNPLLSDTEGLGNLMTVSDYLYISDNGGLARVTGLDRLVSVGSHLSISRNEAITAIEGLNRLASVGGNLSIGTCTFLGCQGNPALSTLQGLSSLRSVGGDLEVVGNSSLGTCEAESLLHQLTDFSGSVTICENGSDECGSDSCGDEP